MSDWQPIETAPKDGSRIILGKQGHRIVYIAHWEIDTGWVIYMCDDDYYSFYVEPDWPTHWQPLPEPPK